MCGITGFIAFNQQAISVETMQQMSDLISHRGPDDEGYFIVDKNERSLVLAGKDTKTHNDRYLYTNTQLLDKFSTTQISFGMAHRRLSIVDLSELGHQPLCIDNGNYWICYNGEVYNHLEIRKELEEIGYNFISNSDTEIIITAYKEWGTKCLHKFNGMFAFIIYDKTTHQVFVARDRFGVKPLYYYVDDKGIYFASEIKQLTVLNSWQPKLNHQIAHDFLVYGLSDHTSQTMFLEVCQLRGGEFTLININNIKNKDSFNITKWYKLPITINSISYPTACKKFEEIFYSSVNLRLRSDVKIGSCLSGGLDSSAIVSVMAEILAKSSSNELLNTFSACSIHKEFDEKEYIDEVVQHTNATPFYCYPTLDDLMKKNDLLTWHQDEPFGSTSIFAQWSVFELAKQQNTTVMLDGQGADEQLAGYQGLYFQIYLNELLHKGQLVNFCHEIIAFKKLHNINIISTIAKSFISLLPKHIKQQIGKILGRPSYNTNWLNHDFIKYNNINPFISGGMNNSSVEDTLYAQIMNNNLSMLLHWEDRDSMAHSIESRVPFLDYRLVEFIFRLPTSYKINLGITKRILRDGLSKAMPPKITNRMSKLGFATPEEIWIKQNHQFFRQRLIENLEICPDIFDKTHVLQIFDEIISGKQAFNFWIWRIISFCTWYRIFKIQL